MPSQKKAALWAAFFYGRCCKVVACYDPTTTPQRNAVGLMCTGALHLWDGKTFYVMVDHCYGCSDGVVRGLVQQDGRR